MDSKYILETEHVSKSFGSLEVLKDINLKVKRVRLFVLSVLQEQVSQHTFVHLTS